MAEKHLEARKEKPEESEHIPDSDTSDEEWETDPKLHTSVEEREYSTVPGLAVAIKAALSYSTAQTNPTIERSIPHKKTKVKKLLKEKAQNKASQTDLKDN